MEDIAKNKNKDSIINSNDYALLIKNLPEISSDIKRNVYDIRKIEKGIRNVVAHSIVKINDDVIHSSTGFTSKEILKKIKTLCIQAGINISSEHIRTYDKLNEKIKKYLI